MSLIKCKECGEAISKKAKQCPKCGSPQKKRTSLVIWFFTIIAGVWLFGYIVSLSNQDPGQPSNPSTSFSERDRALTDVKLDYKWRSDELTMEADFTITNNSGFKIKDVEIECVHFSKSGTRIDSNKRTIYDVFERYTPRKFENFSMGFIHSQAHSSTCTITDLAVM